MPFFSVIIPSYNRANFLKQTISSVQKQTFEDWECIVIDDGSIDNTKDVVHSIINDDNRIIYIYQSNAERSAARNNGIRNAKGNYICFLDSDDEFLSNHLEVLKNEIDKENYSVAFFFTDYICKLNNKIINENIPRLTSNNMLFFFQNGVIPTRVCVHSRILEKEKFDEDITVVEDNILWTRIASKFPVFQIPISTVIYHIHKENSINLKSNPGKKRYDGLIKFISRYPKIAINIPSNIKNKVLSDTLFNIAKHYIYLKKKHCALRYIFYSIIKCPFHHQNKHKLYLMIKLFLGKEIPEYNNIA